MSLLLPSDVSADQDGNVYLITARPYREPELRGVDAGGIMRNPVGSFPGKTQSYHLQSNAVEAVSEDSLALVVPLSMLRGDRLWTATKGSQRASEDLPEIHSDGLRNGASFIFGAVAPGQIISLFGERLGPPEGAVAEAGDDGIVGTELAGTRVLFDGRPAPLLYSHSDQVNAVAPLGLHGRQETTVQLERHGRLSNVLRLTVLPSAPGTFTATVLGWLLAAALNQDHTVNARDNPAHRGEIIILYVTGAGETDPPGEDGKLAIDDLPEPLLPITVEIGGQPAEVVYAGAAPNYVAGALQINARIPENVAQQKNGQTDVIIRVGNTPAKIARIVVE